jgi:YVTN family beta-propeller protein
MNLKPRSCLCAALLLGCLFVATGRSQFLETVIGVGENPWDVLWNPTSNKVYTANDQGGSVTVIDGVSNQVLATVAVADYPVSLCWNSVSNKVYVTCGDPAWLYVIDGVGDTVIKSVRMRGYPSLMTYNATMNKLYVLCVDDNVVRVFDGEADTLEAEVWLGYTSGTLLWHPVTNRVFCSLYVTDSVLTIDCAVDEVVERLKVGDRPYGMCWNPANNLVYVGARYAAYVLSPTGDSVVAQIPACVFSLCAVPLPNRVYVSDIPGILVIDGSSNTVVDTIPAIGGRLLCDSARHKAYVTNQSPGVAFVVDARTDSLVKTIWLGQYPDPMCWNRTNSRVYIADEMDDVVYVIRDTTTGIAEPEVAVVNRPPLIRASPNPFARTVSIECGARLAPGAGICIFSQDGRQVKKLVPGLTLPGSPTTSTWDGKDELGRCVPRGVYLAVVEGQCGVRVKLVKLG